MEPQDAVKLCYQAAFGAEHLLTDPDAAARLFAREWAQTAPAAGSTAERIGPCFCRLDLAAWKERGLPGDWLFRLFTLSQPRPEGRTAFASALAAADALVAAGALPFSPAAWRTYRAAYAAGGIRPIHHSEGYRAAERPAYRVADARLLRLLPLLELLAARPQGGVIALDGRAASGKTTLAGWLETVAGAAVVHMDDFFLPPELRTLERLAVPGGNLHTERFLAEALPGLRSGASFSYRRFDCETGGYAGSRTVPAALWRVAEGAYSCHPDFGDYAAVRVFSDVTPDEQLRRIRLRNGSAAAEVFARQWIPMEEAYFRAFSIRERAHLILPEALEGASCETL